MHRTAPSIRTALIPARSVAAVVATASSAQVQVRAQYTWMQLYPYGHACIRVDKHVSARTACVRVDTWVSIVMELIECSDDVHTMQRSARVRNIPHTQIEHVSICAEFFCKVSTTLRCSMQDSAGVMHGVLCIHADMHVRTYPHHSALLRTSLSINGPLLRPSQHCIVSSVI